MNLDCENTELIINILVKNREVPRYIYKYTDIESLKKILENSTLKFSKPSEFNDPFDCNVTIDTNNTIEEINSYIEILRKNHIVTDEQIEIFHNPILLFNLTNNEIKKSKESFGLTVFQLITIKS